MCTEPESRERMGWKAATPLTLTHLPFRLKWNGKDCQAGYALRQLSIENSLNWAVPELACPAELTHGKRKARAKSEKHARRGVRLLPFRVSYPSCTPLACFRSPENRQKMQDWSLIVFRMSLWSRVSLPLPTGEFLIKNSDWNVEGNYSIDFSIYSVWRRNKTKAKLWYEFNYSSSPLRKWLDNACKYWMIISPPFLINYTKKLLILDKITGVPSFTIDTDIGIRAIQLPSEIRCYLKNVEGLLQKGWRSDQSLIGFLLGCFLRHIVFRNKMLFFLKHYPGSDGDAYCHHQLRYMLDIRVPSFMQ